ncbi:MAG: XRE family transcriptional regulator [Lachnospiraceae bacterium]|nr:XRE family transcriptional regulator [Lachnospiraceae bacterium]
MDWYSSIGEMLKWFIKDVRNKTIKETAMAMGINYTTFSEQLKNNTLSAETLLRLAAYLDIDLNWMLLVLGYHGVVGAIDREMIPRMSTEFRETEKKRVLKRLDTLIKENPTSTPDTRRELLREFSKNMFYLLDVLVPEEYNLYIISERGKVKYYVDIPKSFEEHNSQYVMRRKSVNVLYEGSKALDILIEERKEKL